jgi:hypothetical protein
MLDGQLADGVHSRVKIERREPGTSVANLGNAGSHLHLYER